jgi:heat-inducible transcriptional repressor
VQELDQRKAAILEAVIDHYIRTAEPVGSKVLAEQRDMGVSTATIRSEMAVLEDLGYLVQPHTSAGRVPTDKGYRYYVDSLRQILELAEGDSVSLTRKLAELKQLEQQDMLRQISSVLASRTCTISLVLSPDDSKRVYFWGISQILHQPEFGDVRRVEYLFDLLEGEFRLAEMLTEEIDTPQVHVRIGSENRHSEFMGLSLVAASYTGSGAGNGVVGLLGPTRMDYGTAIPMVDFTARHLSRLLEEA